MNGEEAEEYAKNMTYQDAIRNTFCAKGIRYKKATRIKLHELAEIADKLVLCKDCKYRDTNYGQAENDECRWLADERPNDDDYCSFGERDTTA